MIKLSIVTYQFKFLDRNGFNSLWVIIKKLNIVSETVGLHIARLKSKVPSRAWLILNSSTKKIAQLVISVLPLFEYKRRIFNL